MRFRFTTFTKDSNILALMSFKPFINDFTHVFQNEWVLSIDIVFNTQATEVAKGAFFSYIFLTNINIIKLCIIGQSFSILPTQSMSSVNYGITG